MRQLKITKQITNRNEGSIDRYLQEVNKYSIITAEEEVELSRNIRAGDNDALKKLVLANLRFVISVAKQYQNQGLSLSDLISEGNVGLIVAAKRFDETRGFKFISYAVWWIRQSIIQAISEKTRIVRLPLNRVSTINKISKKAIILEQELNREPTNDEIADYLEISNDEVIFFNAMKKRHISFDTPLPNDNNDLFLYDIIQNQNAVLPDYKLVEQSLCINIKIALRQLSFREASIMTMLFGLSGTPIYTLHDVAIKHKISSERVRQIKNNCLFKLKSLLKGNKAFQD